MFRIIRKIIKWTAITVVALVMLAALGVFLLASWRPSGYEPVRLSESEKHKVASNFFNKVVNAFLEGGQKGRAFSLSFTQNQINHYLTSMDHIAVLRTPVEHGEVYKLIDEVGLAEPVVNLRDGVLVIMIRTREYEKVLSAGLTFTFGEDASLKIDLHSAYIGRAPVPKALVRNRLQSVKAILREQMEKMQTTSTQPTKPRGVVLVGFSSRDIARVIRGAIMAIDEEPIPARDLVSKTEGNRIRITDIDIKDRQVTLHFVPGPKPTEKKTGS